MSPNLSIYLDCVRFLAALAVLISHLDSAWVHGFIPAATHLGLAAVGVFFVLSGFVIGFVADGRENTLRTYAVNRAARLYSVTIPCLVLTFVLDAVGQALHPQYYSISWPPLSGAAGEILQILFSLTFLNHLWSLDIIPGSNGPFWSLCYEVSYYFLFGSGWYMAGRWRWVVIAPAGLCFGPPILLLFPLWLLGLWCYRFCRRNALSPSAGRVILLAAFLFTLLCEAVRWRLRIGWESPTGLWDDWQLYAAGIPFAGSIVGMNFARLSLDPIGSAARHISGATFTLYLLHFPLSRFIAAALPADWPAGRRWVVILALNLLAAFLVARYTERRKSDWRDAILRVLQFIGTLKRTYVTR